MSRKADACDRDKIEEFKEWLETVPVDTLRSLVTDAYWKQQLRGTEIHRFFLLKQKAVDMISTV
jgi:hypothetical protein